MAIREWPRGAMAMIPLLFSGTHLALTVLLNATTYSVSAEGVHVKEGVIPAGYRDQKVARSEIRSVYWRYNFRVPRSGEASHWAAGVATRAGDWIDTSPRFEIEAKAHEAALQVGKGVGGERGAPGGDRTTEAGRPRCVGAVVLAWPRGLVRGLAGILLLVG